MEVQLSTSYISLLHSYGNCVFFMLIFTCNFFYLKILKRNAKAPMMIFRVGQIYFERQEEYLYFFHLGIVAETLLSCNLFQTSRIFCQMILLCLYRFHMHFSVTCED